MPTNFRESGFLDAVEGSTKFVRVFGHVRAGTTGLGRQGRRRLDLGYEKARAARVDDAKRALARSGTLTNAELRHLALQGLQLLPGRLVNGNPFTLDRYAIEAILEKLACQGGIRELQEIYDGRGTWQGLYDHARNPATGMRNGVPAFRSARFAELWNRAVATSDDVNYILKRLPYTIHGRRDQVLEHLNGGELSELHDAASWLLELVILDPVSEKARSNLLNALLQVAMSTNRRGMISTEVLGVFFRTASCFRDLRVPVPGVGPMDGEQFIGMHINQQNGNYTILPVHSP